MDVGDVLKDATNSMDLDTGTVLKDTTNSKDVFSEDQSHQVDVVFEKLEGTGVTFPYTI